MARLFGFAGLISLPAVLLTILLISGLLDLLLREKGPERLHWSVILMLALLTTSLVLLVPLLAEGFSRRRLMPSIRLWWTTFSTLAGLCLATLTHSGAGGWNLKFFSSFEVAKSVYGELPKILLGACSAIGSPGPLLGFFVSLYFLTIPYCLLPLLAILAGHVAMRETLGRRGAQKKNGT